MDSLENGWSRQDYHRYNKDNFTGLNVANGSNTDLILSYMDDNSFDNLKAIEEQNKAHSIDYAHGLELDDMGDDSDTPRAPSLDDQTYRFYLKAHDLIKNSHGTLQELINIASTLLGCDKQDIQLEPTQYIDDNKQSHGEEDTIQIKNMDISKVRNVNLIPLLEDQLQQATAGAQRIKQLYFAVNNQSSLALDAEIGATIEFTI